MKILGMNIGGSSKRTSNLQDAQVNLANQQRQTFQDVMPQYMKGLDFLSNYAGLGNFHPASYGSYAGGMPAQGAGQPGNTPLGGYYNPPPQMPGQWNWADPGAQGITPATPATHPMQYIFGSTQVPKGQGDPMGPSPYCQQPPFDALPTLPRPDQQQMTMQGMPSQGKGDPIPQLPAVNRPPQQMQQQPPGVVPQQMQTPASPVMSRQQQFIQGNPQMGAFNPTQSGSQNFTQMRQAQNNGAQITNPNAASGGGGMGPNPYLNNGAAPVGGVSNQQMGIFNDPADALRNAQAQDDINHQNYLMQQNMMHQLNGRGIEDSSVLSGGLSRLNQGALQDYAGYRRNLAMNAGQEQANRVAQMMQALNPGMGMAQQAQSVYGGVGQQNFQQQQAQQQAMAGYGQLLGQLYGYGAF